MDRDSGDVDSSSTPPGSPLALTPRRESLRDALGTRSATAEQLYVAGLTVLADASNPCAARLAAHSMRELVDVLARKAGVERARGPDLKPRVQTLRTRYTVLREVIAVPAPAAASVQSLVAELDLFFDGFVQDFPSRKREAEDALRRLSTSPMDAPASIIGPSVDRWLGYLRYFSQVAHGKSVTDHEFRAQLESFEAFLTDWLAPKTSDDFLELDRLIEGGPLGG